MPRANASGSGSSAPSPEETFSLTQQRLELFWLLPASGDGSYLGIEKGHHPVGIGRLRDVIEAADRPE